MQSIRISNGCVMPVKQCEQCGKDHFVKPNGLAKGWGRHCSHACRAASISIPPEIEAKIIEAYKTGISAQKAGELFGYGRGGVAKVLERNGLTRRSISQSLKGRVFSEEHKRKISETHYNCAGTNNPMFGKPPGHGKSIFVPHLGRKVRSTWEAFIATLLLDSGIPHEYETQRIQLSDRTYLPDFYIPEISLHVEIKGWRNARFEKTLEVLRAEMPDIRLAIIGPAEYKAIKADQTLLRQYLKPSALS